MNLAVIGTGNVGRTLGRRWASLGHEVVFGSRDPNHPEATAFLRQCPGSVTLTSQREAAQSCGTILLAVSWPAAQQVVQELGDLSNRLLIDCINPINADFSGLDLGFDTSGAEQISQWATGAHVVKAFNTISCATMDNPDFANGPATLLYCGDDEESKQTVARLAHELGLVPSDAGPLKMARYLEPLAMLAIHMAAGDAQRRDWAMQWINRQG